MSENLNDFMNRRRAEEFAVKAGTNMHERLRHIVLNGECSDKKLLEQIRSRPELHKYFTDNAKTEVPVAGIVRGKFISRRIDRMVIDKIGRNICILDYKTDSNPDQNRAKYISQLREYRELMHMIYPDFKIETAILWTHDWRLEKV